MKPVLICAHIGAAFFLASSFAGQAQSVPSASQTTDDVWRVGESVRTGAVAPAARQKWAEQLSKPEAQAAARRLLRRSQSRAAANDPASADSLSVLERVQESARLLALGSGGQALPVRAATSARVIGMPDSPATGFTISGASTTAQTLGPAAGEIGTVTATGSLTISGSTVAVTISGSNETLNNLGTISQTGTGRVVRDNTGVTGLVVNNGRATNSTALMQTADADVIQMNKSPASVTLNNYGTMNSLNASKGGAQAVDFAAILSGSNIVNNFGTGILQARDADAVRPGVNGLVTNDGKIIATHTTDTSDDGIDAQTNSGVQITNANTNSAANPNLIEGARHGITGGAASSAVVFTMSITNKSNGTIKGDDGSGVNIDGFNANENVTIGNDGTIVGNGVTGDGDGVDVDGLVTLTNTGTIKSLNAFSSTSTGASEGITAGGGTITNSGVIEGDVASGNATAVGRGMTLAGVDTSGTPEPIYGNSVVTNQNGGLIRGQTDSGIVVLGGASGFTVTINNNAGATVEGGGATAAAIQTGADNDTINNAGAIVADNSGKAIDMGAGNDTLNVTGGSATISGDASGGTGTNSLTVDPGVGQSFSYAGSFSNFSSAEVKSGTVTLSGANTYTGTTLISGGTLKLENNNSTSARLAGTNQVTVNTGATLSLSQSGATASSDRINDSAQAILNGGTFNTGGLSEHGLANNTAGMGAFTLQSSSVVDLGNASSVVAFANSILSGWNPSATLSIYNWSGTPLTGGGTDQLYFGNVVGGLSPAQLAQIQFYAGAGTGAFLPGAIQLPGGEVVPTEAVPEPSTWVALTVGLILLVAMRRRTGTNAG